MKTIGIIANCSKPRAPLVLARIRSLARRLGLNLIADTATARLMKGEVRSLPISRLALKSDAILALGGDGTVLRVVRLLAGRRVPVMGVNMGGLGFLTSVAEADLEAAMAGLVSDTCETTTRSLVQCVISGNRRRPSCFHAMNDVVVASSLNSRIITLEVEIERERVASYSCDGIIVATPTGSTGHSLSAGGPIVMPDASVLVISLICPHTLSYRPLVVPDRLALGIRVAEKYSAVHLSVDGQVGCPLKEGDFVAVSKSEHAATLLLLPGSSYFSLLRHKLRWTGSNR